jgi:hypothetical protein
MNFFPSHQTALLCAERSASAQTDGCIAQLPKTGRQRRVDHVAMTSEIEIGLQSGRVFLSPKVHGERGTGAAAGSLASSRAKPNRCKLKQAAKPA